MPTVRPFYFFYTLYSLVFLQCTTAAQPEPKPSTSEKIVFSADRDGNRDLFMIAPDGTGLQQLTQSSENERSPRWAPDGSWIAYARRKNNRGQIYRMQADGSGVRNLSNNGVNELDPAISPNGQWIAFSSKVAGEYHLFVMDAEGQQRRQLTRIGDFNGRADWSPDGSRLVFLSFRNNAYNLYIIRADGTGLRQLTQGNIEELNGPTWAPNGYHILFGAHENDVDYLFRIQTNGTNLQKISEPDRGDFNGRFRPDGQQLVFTSVRDGSYNLYTADLQSGVEKRLTDWTGKEDQADWWAPQPKLPQMTLDPPFSERTRIAFTSWRGGSADIYFMRPDGSKVQQMTDTEDDNSYAEWGENGQLLRFKRSQRNRNFRDYERDLATGTEQLSTAQPIVPGATFEQTSPDGRYVAYLMTTEGINNLWLYDTQTKASRAITENTKNNIPAHSVNHGWSPDGREIAFMSGPDWYNQFLRIYNLESGETRVITERGYMNSGLLWLRNSRQLIVNIKIRDKTIYELWSIDADGSNLKQLTGKKTETIANLHPQLSPDGNWVLFESQRHGDDGEIYIMRPDGSQQTRLTFNPGYEGRPCWFILPE